MSSKVTPEHKVEIDPKVNNGPIEERECQDLLCCLLFIFNIAAIVAMAIYGFSKGSPSKMAAPYDGDGKACGIDYPDNKYIYFVSPWTPYLHRTTCVKTCPNWPSDQSGWTSLGDCKQNQYVKTCDSSIASVLTAVNSDSIQNSISENLVVIYNTTTLLGRICFPYDENLLAKIKISEALDIGLLDQWMSDLESTWETLLISAGIALVAGFVYMITLRFCAGVLTWVAIIGYIVGLAVLGIFFYRESLRMADNKAANNGNTSSQYKNERTFFWGAVTCWVLSGLGLLLTICLFNKIRLAIAIIKTAAMFVNDNPLVLLVPIVFFILLAGFWAFWISGALYLYSVGDIKKGNYYPFASVTWTKETQYIIIYFIFGGLWTNAFIQALQQFVLASTCSIWYFSQGPGQEAHRPISRSIYRAFRYHLGSIAFGSLILAIVQFIRLILSYIEYQMKKAGSEPNAVVKFLLRCLQCYMACFERFIRFLNKNAYIQISITGKSFCMAAKDAFFLILRNPAKFGVVGTIGNIFITFGKLFVCFIATLGTFLILQNVKDFRDEVDSPVLPVILYFIISFGIGDIFMSVYGMACDTVLQCYITDSELNRSPKYSPAPLREFIDNIPDKK